MNTFKLTVLAAEKPFFEGECVSLVIPAVDGQYGIQAHHYNMIGAVVPGVLKITSADGNEIVAASSEGIVKVENNEVLLLLDTVELPEEIDENRAHISAEEAKEAFLKKKSIQDYYMAQAKMSRALSRLKVKKYQK